jgi:hypothetical protein
VPDAAVVGAVLCTTLPPCTTNVHPSPLRVRHFQKQSNWVMVYQADSWDGLLWNGQYVASLTGWLIVSTGIAKLYNMHLCDRDAPAIAHRIASCQVSNHHGGSLSSWQSFLSCAAEYVSFLALDFHIQVITSGEHVCRCRLHLAADTLLMVVLSQLTSARPTCIVNLCTRIALADMLRAGINPFSSHASMYKWLKYNMCVCACVPPWSHCAAN